MTFKESFKAILPERIVKVIIDIKRWFYVKKELYKYPYYQKLINAKERSDKIRIIFYSSTPEFYNSMKTVFEAADRDPRVDAYIFLLPLKEGTDWHYCSEEFYRDQGLKLCKAYDVENKTWTDLKSLKPDYVFFETPYNDRLYKCYRSSQVEKYAKICYIPYGYILTESKQILDIVMNSHFFVSLYIFFASWDGVGVYCEWLFSTLGCKDRKIAYLGYPRFDLTAGESGNAQDSLYVIMWIPRFQAKGVTKTGPTSHTSFFDYKDRILTRGRTHDEKWLIRPHPFAFKTYVEQGLMTNEEVERYKRDIDHMPNVELDKNRDYLSGFSEADVLVADFSSIIIEFFITGKPIIFCDDINSLPFEHLKECVYPASNWQQVETILEKLKAGDDPLKEKRAAMCKEVRSYEDGGVGKRIIEYIIDDYKRVI